MDVLLQNQTIYRRKNISFKPLNRAFFSWIQKIMPKSGGQSPKKYPNPYWNKYKKYWPAAIAVPFFVAFLGAAFLPKEDIWDIKLPPEGLIFPEEGAMGGFYYPEFSEVFFDDGIEYVAEGDAVIDLPSDAVLQTVSSEEYVVQDNDVLSAIAYKNDLALGTLISFNKIRNADKLKPGDVIKIPNMDGVLLKVKWGDNLNDLAKEYDISVNAILDANNLESSNLKNGMELFLPHASMDSFDLKRALNMLFLTPARGVVTSRFGYRKDPFTGLRRFHNGMDIAGSSGTTIKAALDGRVSQVGYHSSYGNYIIISHSKGYQTLYAHLQKALVYKGQRITQGAKIGLMGSTGYSTGNHLHFTVFENKKPVDPLKFLKL